MSFAFSGWGLSILSMIASASANVADVGGLDRKAWLRLRQIPFEMISIRAYQEFQVIGDSRSLVKIK